MTEWERFKVGKPSTRPTWTEQTCQPFSAVGHTSHIDLALRIINDREVRPSLIFDKSILNDQRILVSWISPNYWGPGFRYGNIRFQFAFDELITGRNYYWVESIAYGIAACRILITDVNRDTMLSRYDPTINNGPWWFDLKTGKHYFNGNHCLEFMVEAPLQTRNVRELDFVKHHTNYCSMHRTTPSRCAELGFNEAKAGAYFLTRAVVTGTELRSVLARSLGEHSSTASLLKSAYNHFIFDIIGRHDPSGTITSGSAEGIAVARAIMSAYTFGQLGEATLWANKFQDIQELTTATSSILTEATGFKDWTY
jgi:hypothetical protein